MVCEGDVASSEDSEIPAHRFPRQVAHRGASGSSLWYVGTRKQVVSISGLGKLKQGAET